MIDDESNVICPRCGGRMIEHRGTSFNYTRCGYVEQDVIWSDCELCGFVGDY